MNITAIGLGFVRTNTGFVVMGKILMVVGTFFECTRINPIFLGHDSLPFVLIYIYIYMLYKFKISFSLSYLSCKILFFMTFYFLYGIKLQYTRAIFTVIVDVSII